MRRLVVLVPVLMLAGSLAACGASDEADAVPTTSATAQAEATPTPTPTPTPVTAQSVTDAVLQAVAAPHNFSFATSGSDSVSALDTTGSFDGADAQLAEADARGEEPTLDILVDGVYYANIPPATKGLYWKIPPEADVALDIVSFTFERADPAVLVSAIQQGATAMAPVPETQELDGVVTHGYSFTVDTTKLGDRVGGRATAIADKTDAAVPAQATFVLWIGDDHLPRKITTDLIGFSPERVYTGWGAAPAIVAPPADQVTDQDPSKG